MKKFLVCLSFMMMFTAFSVWGEGEAFLEANSDFQGDNVTVTLSCKSSEKISGGSMNLVYNNEKAELISATLGEGLNGTSCFINPAYRENTVRFNWISFSETENMGEILVAKFKLFEENTEEDFFWIEDAIIIGEEEKGIKIKFNGEEVSKTDKTESSVEKPSSGISGGETNRKDGENKAETPNNRDKEVLKNNSATGDENIKKMNFKDVKESDWFFGGVKFVFEKGLMKGVGEEEFSPDTYVNRAMFATVVHRLDGEPKEVGETVFSDVSEGYFKDAVIWAEKNGIITGVSDSLFDPEGHITREQAAAIIYRYFEYKGYEMKTEDENKLLEFDDANLVSPYAKKTLEYAVEKGFINGEGNGKINPLGKASRAEISEIIKRVFESL